jgi:hypothetical protein
VDLLRRALVWQAVAWALAGVGLLVAPRWIVETLFDQPPIGEEAWLRVAGLMAVALAAQIVLVTRRIEDLWWWSWTFALLDLGVAAIAALNALVGLPDGAPSWPWWGLAALSAGFGALDIAGIAKTGTERSPL